MAVTCLWVMVLVGSRDLGFVRKGGPMRICCLVHGIQVMSNITPFLKRVENIWYIPPTNPNTYKVELDRQTGPTGQRKCPLTLPERTQKPKTQNTVCRRPIQSMARSRGSLSPCL